MTTEQKTHPLEAFANHLHSNGWAFIPNSSRGADLVSSAGHRVNPDFIGDMFTQWSTTDYAWNAGSLQRLKQYKILPLVIGESLNPTTTAEFYTGENGFGMKNLYKPFKRIRHTLDSDDITPYHDFMASILPDEGERVIVEKWMAHLLQDPAHRKPWHVLVTGTQGTGKGTLFEMLSHLVPNYADVNSFRALDETHSTHFVDNLLIHFNDVSSIDDKQQDRLKAKLSDSSTTVRPLYSSAITKPIFARVIYSSNERRPIRLAGNERRWFCPAYMETKQNTKPFKDWLAAGGLNLVFDYLSVVDVSDMPDEAPRTETFYQMVDASRSLVDLNLETFLESHTVFTLDELDLTFGNNTQLAAKKLGDLNYKASRLFRKVVDRDGNKNNRNYWHPATMTPAAAREHLASLATPY